MSGSPFTGRGTPAASYMLASLEANVRLVLGNARLAAEIASELAA